MFGTSISSSGSESAAQGLLKRRQEAERVPSGNVVIVSADSNVLDRDGAWYNLARETIVQHVPQARVVELG